MFDEQKLILLARSTTRTMTGWINPEHTILHTADYGHVDGLRDYSPFTELLDAAEQAKARGDASEQSCRDLIEQGEHPEWHSYEMYGQPYHTAAEEVRRFCLVYAYHLGYVRVFYDARNRKLTLEGEEAAIARYKPAALRVAKELAGTYQPDVVESKFAGFKTDAEDRYDGWDRRTLEKMKILHLIDNIYENSKS